ncbi:MAG: DUF4430 domain-containing protein, partial [Dehalococcoidia bacterium]|nr:DUF4430 domain-containing protein [Dehalococcoidia bacterium]
MRQQWRLLASLAPAAVIAALLTGCAPGAAADGATPPVDPSGPAQARIVVTTDFGTHPLLDVIVGLDAGTSAMVALESVAETQTAYGGGFVRGINGVGTGDAGNSTKADWFYYVNGLTARTGAKDYVLRDGDVEHWDRHPWSSYKGLSAVIGCFPWAFINGYAGERRPSVVAYEAAFAEEAGDIASLLERSGAADVSLVPLADVMPQQRESCHLVIVAEPDASLVRELFDKRTKLGFFTSLEGSVLRTYSPSGEETAWFDAATGVLTA